MDTPFWLASRSCKKYPIINKETSPNGEKFFVIIFNARSKCPEASLPIIDLSSVIKTFLSTGICFSTYEEFHHLAFHTRRMQILP